MNRREFVIGAMAAGPLTLIMGGQCVGKSVFTERDTAIAKWTEWSKCRDDFPYFFKTYIKLSGAINNGDELNAEQKYAAMRHFSTDPKVNWAPTLWMARRTGKTTLSAAIALHKITFFHHQYVGYAAPNMVHNNMFRDMILDMHRELPVWMKPKTTVRNRLITEFDNGGTLFRMTHSSRGRTVDLAIFDEYNFFEWKAKKLMDDIYPSICSGPHSKILALSS